MGESASLPGLSVPFSEMAPYRAYLILEGHKSGEEKTEEGQEAPQDQDAFTHDAHAHGCLESLLRLIY